MPEYRIHRVGALAWIGFTLPLLLGVGSGLFLHSPPDRLGSQSRSIAPDFEWQDCRVEFPNGVIAQFQTIQRGRQPAGISGVSMPGKPNARNVQVQGLHAAGRTLHIDKIEMGDHWTWRDGSWWQNAGGERIPGPRKGKLAIGPEGLTLIAP